MEDHPGLLVAVIQQLALAIMFVLIPMAARKYGHKAQKAAERSVQDQGVDGKLLSEHGIKFSESKLEMLLPLGFATAYLVTASLILLGNSSGQIVTLIITPITLVIVGLVTAQQVFASQFIERAFRKSSDKELRKIDVERFVSAALKEFPAWLRPLQIIRFLVATVGSAIVFVAFALF